MEAVIELQCTYCLIKFTRRLYQHRRNPALGRLVFCTKECSYKYATKRDEFSPFRSIIKNMKNRIKENPYKSGNIDLEFLKKLWDQQDGICPYTGWKLRLLSHENEKTPITPNRASLDRIDSSRGYYKDNVQFVAWMYQMAKNVFTDEQVAIFCKDVTNYAKL